MGDDFPDEEEGLANTFGRSQPSLNLELNKKFSLEPWRLATRIHTFSKNYLDSDTP